ncbi:hypothetical protein IX57_13645, partial [Paracoccus sanguinis]
MPPGPARPPRGVLIRVGGPGDMPPPLTPLAGREIAGRGPQRSHDEFAGAAGLIGRREIAVRPIISHALPLARADEAFRLASDRTT